MESAGYRAAVTGAGITSAPGARLLYVPEAMAETVRRRVGLTEAAEAALAEISAINVELLARRELE